jgi:acyl carrier protein
MIVDAIVDRVMTVVAGELGIEPEELPNDATLNKFDKWDSLNHISVLLALEKEFGVEVSEDTIRQLSSIPAIMKHLRERTR